MRNCAIIHPLHLELETAHYKKVLERGANPYAANNAGVEARSLDLTMTSVDYFTNAADQNNTLAMANMAAYLIDAGFEKQATDLLEKARQQEDVHENVDTCLGRIRKNRRIEIDKTEELEGKVKTILKWRQTEAEAIAISPIAPTRLVGRYKQSNGSDLIITCQDDGMVLGEAKGADELLTFSGRVEGALLRFRWNTVPVKKSLGDLRPVGLIGFALGTSQPASGIGAFAIEETERTLVGYRVTSNTPLDPIEWTISRYPD